MIAPLKPKKEEKVDNVNRFIPLADTMIVEVPSELDNKQVILGEAAEKQRMMEVISKKGLTVIAVGPLVKEIKVGMCILPYYGVAPTALTNLTGLLRENQVMVRLKDKK